MLYKVYLVTFVGRAVVPLDGPVCRLFMKTQC